MDIQFTGNIDASALESIVDEVLSQVKADIDYGELAREIEITEIAQEFSAYDIANEFNESDIADYISIESIVENLDLSSYVSDIAQEVVNLHGPVSVSGVEARLTDLENRLDALTAKVARVQGAMLSHAQETLRLMADDRYSIPADKNRHPIM